MNGAFGRFGLPSLEQLVQASDAVLRGSHSFFEHAIKLLCFAFTSPLSDDALLGRKA